MFRLSKNNVSRISSKLSLRNSEGHSERIAQCHENCSAGEKLSTGLVQKKQECISKLILAS
jgi:hypothetical protein